MNRHAFFARQIEQRFQTIGPRAFENRDRLDLAFARPQRFEHRVWSIDQILFDLDVLDCFRIQTFIQIDYESNNAIASSA